MDQDVINRVCSQVYRQFPEVKGARPMVRAYSGNQSLLIFNGKSTGADGRVIPRTVRVVVDQDGRIGKITTSR